jgi:putative NADH-flavin reductase
MKILVFGASGKTGQYLISQALDKEYQVTAFARHPEKIKMQHPNLKIVQGNVTDYEKVKEAIKGQAAVLSALGASSPFKFDQAVVDGAANIIKAMQAEQVSRLIYMSFIGVKESRNAGGFVIKHIAPRLLSTEIKGHEAREKMIVESPLAWTIIRAVTLTNGNHTGNYKSGEEIMAKGFTATISRADVAELMLHVLDEKNSVYKKLRIMY